ncbi:hypothetical protein FB45DRAFT_1051270 [Roridomyces roridus]|uniref:Uncharacterized protein n=1 Tax=Roridomyces roridus TaxID=1738132 RepID=A0AAD7FYI0_9AGAR|nr:hypothetical protein FB45DRAFT_1051270 [Roridomyces roridus]
MSDAPLTPRSRKAAVVPEDDNDNTPRAAASRQGRGQPGGSSGQIPALQRRSKSLARRSVDSEGTILPELITPRPSWLSPARTNRSREIQEHLPESTSEKISLIDFLSVTPPPVPSIYEDGKLTHTKTISDDALKKIGESDELQRVVPALFMMESLIDAVYKEFDNLHIDPGVEFQRDWLNSLHSYTTAPLMPKEIRSEKDTEDLVLGVLFRPLLAACYAAKMGTLERLDGYPNITSCGGGGKGALIPDAMLWSLHDTLATTIEVKTQGVFVASTDSGDRSHTFNDLLADFPEMGTGYSVRFIWPQVKQRLSTSADKIIVQVWTQMVVHKMKFAALTNYTSVIFFVREGDTLYMSAEYTQDRIFIAIFAFLAYVLGYFQQPTSKPDLPEVVNWWKKYINPTVEEPGIDTTTLPQGYLNRLLARKQSDVFD